MTDAKEQFRRIDKSAFNPGPSEADNAALRRVAEEWLHAMGDLQRLFGWTEDFARGFLAVLAQNGWDVIAMDKYAEWDKAEEQLTEAREALANWMIANSYATGHGETVADLIGELDWQYRNLICATSGTHRDVAEQIIASCKPGALPRITEIVRSHAAYWRDDALRSAAAIALRYEISNPNARDISNDVLGLMTKPETRA